MSLLRLPGLQSIIVQQDGEIVFKYGDTKLPSGNIASCRKSIMAILYGMYPINLDKTLEELDINDKQPLSREERSATIRHLLMSSSGVYHPASNGGDDRNKPPRFSKRPGECFIYNNWDFNALETIFEQETGVPVYQAVDNLGKQIGFKDFDLKGQLEGFAAASSRKDAQSASIHQPHHMNLSARDMLRIGQLMLDGGKCGKKQVVPKKWIKLITSLHIRKKDQKSIKDGDGYGYMWWVCDEEKKHPLHGAFAAIGGGTSITVAPKSNTIIITKHYPERDRLLKKVFDI